MTMGQIIGQKRRAMGLTQEGLASILGVTNQAVSKWESDQCYPDISLLPKIADQFNISIDVLFGRAPEPQPEPEPEPQPEPEQQLEPEPAPAAPEMPKVEGLPWADDRALRAVVYQGHTLLKHMDAAKEMTFTFVGEPVDLHSAFAVNCGNVGGNVEAGGSVTCAEIKGHVDAGGSVTCGSEDAGSSIGGSIDAGGSVRCGDVTGDVEAGGSVTCGNVGKNVDAGGSVTCLNVSGDVDAGTSITCDSIGGDADSRRIIRKIRKK